MGQRRLIFVLCASILVSPAWAKDWFKDAVNAIGNEMAKELANQQSANEPESSQNEPEIVPASTEQSQETVVSSAQTSNIGSTEGLARIVDPAGLDILGLKLGMTIEEAEKELRKIAPTHTIKPITYAAYDTSFVGMVDAKQAEARNAQGLIVVDPVGYEISVHFPPVPNKSVAYAIAREQRFPDYKSGREGKWTMTAPTLLAVKQALLDRYGEPSIGYVAPVRSSRKAASVYIWTDSTCPKIMDTYKQTSDRAIHMSTASSSNERTHAREMGSAQSLRAGCGTILSVVLQHEPQTTTQSQGREPVVTNIKTGLADYRAIVAAEVAFAEYATNWEMKERQKNEEKAAKPMF